MGNEEDVLQTIYPSKAPLGRNADSVGRREPLLLKTTTVELFSQVWLPRGTVTTTAVDGRSRTTWTRSRIRTVLLDFQASKV